MAIKFNCSSEFMDNYKMLYAASTENKMQAVCDDRHEIFSIGDDDQLYVMSEGLEKNAAYQLNNLTSDLGEIYQNRKFEVKNFAVEKIKDTYALAVIITCQGEDTLYLSRQKTAINPKWESIPIDNDKIKTRTISNIYFVSLGEELTIICDIVNQNQLISRYYIDSEDKLGRHQKWISHPLPSDFESSSCSCIGKRKGEEVEGIYTLGEIGGKTQLLYTPIYNPFDPEIMPNPVRLTLPEAVDTIVSVGEKTTHLFAAGSGALYLYPSDEQKDGKEPIKLIASPKFTEVKELYAYEYEESIQVYGRNQSGQIFYCFCPKESIKEPDKWSEPLILMDKMGYVYAYMNKKNNSESILAYGIDHSILTGDKNQATSMWQYQTADLSLEMGHALKFTSFTTKITVRDEEDNLLKEKQVWLKSEQPCSIYINQVYYALNDKPIKVSTDKEGTIKIIQKTQSITPYDFIVWEDEMAPQSVFIGEETINKLLDLNSTEKLRAATITKDNVQCPLVPADISDENVKVVADVIDQLGKSQVQIDRQSPFKGRKCLRQAGINALNDGVLVLASSEGLKSYQGQQALLKAEECQLLKRQDNGSLMVQGIKDKIKYGFSDVIHFLKDLTDKVCKFFVGVVDGICQLVVEIAGEIYNFIVDCTEKMIACIETVFSYICIAMEDVIQFLKYVFDWKDILKTKDILMKLTDLGMDKVSEVLQGVEGSIDELFEKLITKIDTWADIDFQEEMGKKTIKEIGDENQVSQTDSVTDSFLMDHYKENCKDVQILGDHQNLAITVLRENSRKSENEYIEIFEKLAKEEKDAFMTMIAELKKQIFNDNFMTMSFAEIMKKITAIISDTLLYAAKGVIDVLIELIAQLVQSVKDMLEYKIRIPVLSDILEDWFGIQPFSILDVLTLVMASVVTPFYKICMGDQFMTDSAYEQIMALESLDGLRLRKNYLSNAKDTAIIVCVMSHDISSIAGILDVITHPITLFATGESDLQIISTVLGGLSAGAAVLGSFAHPTYKVPEYITSIKVVIKYIPLIAKVAHASKLIPYINNEGFAICTDLVYAIGSCVDAVFGILLIDIATTNKDENKNDYTCAMLEIPANMTSNISTVLDTVTKYDTEVYSRTTFEVIREILMACCTGLHMTESILIAQNN